jgi:hypothetical protein
MPESALEYLRAVWVSRVDFRNPPRVVYISPWLHARAKNEQHKRFGGMLRYYYPTERASDLPFKAAVLRAHKSLRGRSVRFEP